MVLFREKRGDVQKKGGPVLPKNLPREKRGDVQKKGGPVLPKNLPIPLYVSF